MRKALSFEIFIASDFIIGIACGFTWRMRLEHRDVASSVANFILEALGILSTVLLLRRAGIVFGNAEVGHSFCFQLCTFAWFMFLAGLIGHTYWEYYVFPSGVFFRCGVVLCLSFLFYLALDFYNSWCAWPGSVSDFCSTLCDTSALEYADFRLHSDTS